MPSEIKIEINGDHSTFQSVNAVVLNFVSLELGKENNQSRRSRI